MRTLAALACAAALPLAAVDVTPFGAIDVRLGYGWQFDDPQIEADGAELAVDGDQSYRLSGEAVLTLGPSPFGGFCLGLGVVLATARVDEANVGEIEYETVIGQLQVGWAFGFGPIQVELLPFAGIGSSSYDIDQEAQYDDATYYEVGAHLRLLWNLDLGVLPFQGQLGAGASWLYGVSEHDVVIGGNQVDIEVVQESLVGSVYAGVRF